VPFNIHIMRKDPNAVVPAVSEEEEA